jgi:hypothetical protein
MLITLAMAMPMKDKAKKWGFYGFNGNEFLEIHAERKLLRGAGLQDAKCLYLE